MTLNEPRMIVTLDGDEHKISRTFWRGENTHFRPTAKGMHEPEALYRHILAGLMPDQPFIDPETTVVAFGSCFAKHISNHLNALGFNVTSRQGRAYVSSMGDGMVNTFALRQQFEWAWTGRTPEVDLWHGYQADTFGYDEEVRLATKALFDAAAVFIITLGLSEVWYDEPTGEVFWRAVPQAQFDATRHKFRTVTQAENKANLGAIIELIRANRPDAHIVFTLSPVPLAATFQNIGPLPADCLSKASLRSAVDEALRERRDDRGLYYFPAYEVVKDCFRHPFQSDYKHPHQHVVDLNMLAFERFFCRTGLTDVDLESAYASALDRDEDLGLMGHERRLAAPKSSKVLDAPSIEREIMIRRRAERLAEREARIVEREERMRLREQRLATHALRTAAM